MKIKSRNKNIELFSIEKVDINKTGLISSLIISKFID